ncbi:MAG: preprotein translocase subunit SecE [Candidatus Colwellbacteria bacterium]|nr:preprotein translocase subunit SecE [Candidatus Colwellbacteria bacterium]
MFQRLITYVKEVRIELKKVTWPTRQETIRYTLMVIIISAVTAVFLGAIDFILQYVLNAFVL